MLETMATQSKQSNDAPPVDAPVAKMQMDEETVNLLRLRLAELEAEKTHTQTTRLTMASLTNKDIARERFTNRKLVQMAMQEGNIGSKALPAQFEHKADTTHDITASAVRHHTGSHYHMAGSVQFQRG